MSYFFLALLAAVGVAAVAPSHANEARPERNLVVVAVDMPYGACRLVVREDGTASLYYGALPQSIEVRAGTFDPVSLAAELTSRSLPSNERDERAKLAPPIGSVQLGKGNKARWFNDAGYAQRLFTLALLHRVEPDVEEDSESTSLVSSACARTE